MKNKKLIIKNSILIIILCLIQVSFLYYGYDKTLDDIGENAMAISKAVVNTIDVEEYEKLVQSKKRNDYFNHMQQYFRRVQIQTGVKYIYVEHKISDTQMEYIFDAEKDSFGEADELYTPKAHTSKTSINTRVEETDLWGTLISGYSPILNKKGDIVGAVGVDIDVKDFYNELMGRLFTVLAFLTISVLIISLIIYLTLKEEINVRKRAEKSLVKKTSALTNLLNNAGQGFLSFGHTLTVDAEYSAECHKLFGQDPANKKFPELIFPHDQQQQEFLASILQEILQEQDETKGKLYLSLIPEEVSINNKFIRMESKLIEDLQHENSKAIMVILTDITEKHLLENRMENERKVLKMVVKAIVNREDLLHTIKDFQIFCASNKQWLLESDRSLEELISELFRVIHTFKGSFSLLELVNIADRLHEFENKIYELSNRLGNLSLAELHEFLTSSNLSHWLEKDLAILRDALGEQFFQQDRLIEESKLIKLEERMKAILSPVDYELFLKETRRLRYRPFKELLNSYPEYLSKLAEKQEKLINPLTIEGGDIPVETAKYQPFTKSLVHIFRNIVEHGVEPIEERLKQNKNETCTVTCTVKTIDKAIYLTIADDGQGLDLPAIRKKAVEKGIYTEEAVSQLSEEEIITLIFRDDFSTKEKITQLSGRGIGLGAVKNELDKLGGSIEVKTSWLNGVTFNFIIPLIETEGSQVTTNNGEDSDGADSGCR